MTRRTRPAALLSATALAGAALSLTLAPAASADIPAPPLGTLTASSSSPEAGDTVTISGSGCFTLAVPGTSSAPSAASASAASASGATAAADGTAAGTSVAAAPDAAPQAVDDPQPTAGSVAVSITGPDSFNSGDSATATTDGTWQGENGITLGGAGVYTVDASCTLTDPLLGQSVSFDYASITLEVAAPPQVVDPSLNCSGCGGVNPGGSISLGGTGFPASTTATIALSGYASKTSPVDGSGGFAPVSFIIRADQAVGSISGTVSAPGATPEPFTVTVTAVEQPGGTPDGEVPGADTGGTDGTDGGSTDVPVVTGGPTYTSSAPTLPNTGADSVWPGVIGAGLVVAGSGLLWAGRRREDTGTAAV